MMVKYLYRNKHAIIESTQIPQFFQFGSVVKFRQLSNELYLPEKINIIFNWLPDVYLVNQWSQITEGT